MGNFPAALLAALEAGASPRVLAEFDWPVTGTLKAAKRGTSSLTNGHYEDRIVSFGSLRWAATDRRNALIVAPAPTVVANDADGYFTRLKGAGERFDDASVVIYLAAEGVAPANWWPAFTGRVGSHVFNADKTIGLSLRPPDRELQTEIAAQIVTEADWSAAPQESIGRYIPVVLGLHDSTSSRAAKTSDGALPTIWVKSDANPYRYLVGRGFLRVLRGYKDGNKLASTAFTTSWLTINGKPFTTVDFTTSQAPSDITVDCYGLEHVGDGSGDPWMLPEEQLTALCDHFLFADSLGGSYPGTWPSVTSQCDLGSPALYASGARYQGALYVDAPTTGKTLLDAWAADMEVRLYWKSTGKLGLFYDDPVLADFYPSTPWLRPWDFYERLEVPTPDDDRIDRIVAHTGFITNLGRYLIELEVHDPLSGVNVRETSSPTWGQASE